MSAPPRSSAHRDRPRRGRPRTSDRRGGRTTSTAGGAPRPGRPLYTAGGVGAASAAAIGVAALVTLTLVGWVAAPHATFGEDIADVLRAAIQAWLIGHHVELVIPGGRVGMLPIGLLVLPGLLLYRSGRRLARACDLPRLRHVFPAAFAVASPYAAIAGTLALAGRTETVQPSMFQALTAGFLLAFVAGGLGVLHQLLKDKDIPRRRLLRTMPPPPRSLLVGTASATAVLLLSGLLLFTAGLLADLGTAVETTRRLAPGAVGGTLLFVVQVLYLPNAVIFGVSYTAGPGFAVGTDTTVAPTGVALGPVPDLPMLAALPDSGPAPVLSLVALAAPFLAGGLGGALTLRGIPVLVAEAAPLWGFACGAATGALWAGLAALAGGPMGAQRLAVVGPSAWQVGVTVALEVGVAAAITAWVVNWRRLRRSAAPAQDAEATADPGPKPPRGLRQLRLPRLPLSLPRRDRSGQEEAEELYGITYEAESAPDPEETTGRS